MKSLNYSVVILGAGLGSRMNLGYNKILYKHNGHSIIYKTVTSIIESNYFDQVIVVINQVDELHIKKELKKYPNIQYVYGGKTRQESVFNSLDHVTNDLVFIHDGARSNITKELLMRLIEDVELNTNYQGYALACQVKDTILKVEDYEIKQVLERSILYTMQTPQVSNPNILKKHLMKAQEEGRQFTDEMSLLTFYGLKTKIVKSEYYNNKVTTIEDIR